MILKSFTFPSASAEHDIKTLGGFTLGMPCKALNNLPFEIFPSEVPEKVLLGNITVFCGGASSLRSLTVHVMVSKLIEPTLPARISHRLLRDYVALCGTQFNDDYVRELSPRIYITSEQVNDFIDSRYARIDVDRNWSVLDFFESRIPARSLVIIDSPESYMSLSELEQFAFFICDMVKHGRCQFLLVSNSPVIFGIKNAVIYDFDEKPIKGTTWCHSRLAADHVRYSKELLDSHKQTKKGDGAL